VDFSAEDFQWPSDEHTLFRDEAGWDSAVFTRIWSRDQWMPYATGFREAGDRLLEDLLDRGRHHDLLVYPIVFLYRHHIELMLKFLIQDMHRMLDKDPPSKDILKTHFLRKLWGDLEGLTDEWKGRDWKSEPDAQSAARLIRELDKADPKSEMFRYPSDHDMEFLEMRSMRNAMAALCNFLEAMSLEIERQRDFDSEMREYYSPDFY